MLVGVFGELGSGKNVYVTRYVLKHFAGFYGDAPIYDRCFSNYRIDTGNPSRPVETLTKEAFRSLEHLRNVLVVIDEAYLWLDSRRSTSKSNIDISYVVLQSRKRGFDIIYLAQIASSVDLRLRDLSDIWVFCERKRNGDFVYTEVWRGNRPKVRTRKLPLKAAQRIFERFDTFEIVSPV